MKVKEYAAVWTERHPRPELATDKHNEQMVADFVRRYGNRTLPQISPRIAADYGREKPGSIRYLRAMFNDAKKDGELRIDNPFAGLKVNGNGSRRATEVPTLEEIEAVVKVAQPWLAAAIEFSAFVGPRIGELCALESADLKPNSIVTIDKQLQRNGVLKRLTKGKEGRRDAHVPMRGVLAVARGTQAHGCLFGGGDGKPLDYWRLRRGWTAARDDAGVEFEWMQLRTFCASWLIDNGASPLDVALQLHGHTDPRVVLQYYAMVDKGKALERLREVAP
jgi:integrase